jgi:hypothetical protein
LDTVESFGGGRMPANINRYLLRAVDLDIAAGQSGTFVYCKFAKFILVGFIEMSYPKQWIGTKIHVREGHVGRGNFTLPKSFGDFIFGKSTRYAELNESISEKQQEKFATTMRGDLVRTAESGSFAALDADVRLFGQRALRKSSSEDER